MAPNVHCPQIRTAVIWMHCFVWQIAKHTYFAPPPQHSSLWLPQTYLSFTAQHFEGSRLQWIFLCVNTKTPVSWLMKYCCFHISFSEVWGSKKPVWKVSDKKLVSNCSFLRPGKVKSGHWGSWWDAQQWNDFSWSKWVLLLLLYSHHNWTKDFPTFVLGQSPWLGSGDGEGHSWGWAQPLCPRERRGGPGVLGALWKQVGKGGTWLPAGGTQLEPRAGGQGSNGPVPCPASHGAPSTAPGRATTAVPAPCSSRGAGRGHRQPLRSPGHRRRLSTSPGSAASQLDKLGGVPGPSRDQPVPPSPPHPIAAQVARGSRGRCSPRPPGALPL